MRRPLLVLFLALLTAAMAQDPIIIGVNLELSGRMTVSQVLEDLESTISLVMSNQG